jgi:plasmid stabilization system protein ParE
MRYTVLWTPMAEGDLASIWLVAEDRLAVTAAADAIDQLLTAAPEAKGEVRFDVVCTLTVSPLAIDYEVVDADRIVYVLNVWHVASTKTNGKPR